MIVFSTRRSLITRRSSGLAGDDQWCKLIARAAMRSTRRYASRNFYAGK